jgi:hypothetical protein
MEPHGSINGHRFERINGNPLRRNIDAQAAIGGVSDNTVESRENISCRGEPRGFPSIAE